MKTLRFIALALALMPLFAFATPPETRKLPVQDTYWDTVVTDNYRWLEDPKDKDVKAWSDAQNVQARAYLARLPAITPLRERLKKILTARTITHTRIVKAGDHLFAMKSQPPREQPFLVVLPSVEQPGQRSGDSRPDPARQQGDHRHRLVRALAGRQARRRLPVQGRQRGGRSARLRRRHGQAGPRGHSPRAERHGRRRSRLVA